jgi:hypothetical protein
MLMLMLKMAMAFAIRLLAIAATFAGARHAPALLLGFTSTPGLLRLNPVLLLWFGATA